MIGFSIFSIGLRAQVVFSEDFESGALPSGWQIKTKSADGGWKFGTATSLSSGPNLSFYIPTSNGTKMAATNDDNCSTCNKTADILITSPIDLSSYTKLVLQMDLFYGDQSYNGIQESFTVVGSTDGGTNWVELGKAKATNGWERFSVDVSAMAGNNNVLIGFFYSDGGDWLYGAAMDNVVIKVPNPRDAQIVSLTSKNYGKTGINRKVNGILSNNGSDTLTSITLEWTDGVTPHQETFTGLSIAPYTSGTFELTDPVTLVEGDIAINVTASKPNGLDDFDTSNDSQSSIFTGYTLHPNKGVLAEEATGTWCQWCPRGAVFMDFMKQEYGDQFVGVAVHNNDPMVVTTYDAGYAAFPGFGGYPTIIMNKKDNLNSDAASFDIELPFLKSASETPDAEITAKASYKKDTKELKISATVTSNVTLTGAKFFMTLTEEDVTGTTSDFDQANVYSGLGIPMGGFESLANPVPASQMIYNHVARALFGTFNGITGSISQTLPANEAYTYEYTGYTIPAEYNIANLHMAIAVLGSNNQVINVIEIPLEEATSSHEVFNNNLVSVSPNPFTEVTYLKLDLQDTKEVSMKVFNSLGQIVASKDYGKLSGSQSLPFYANSLANGMYYIHLTVGNELVTKQVILNRASK